MRPKPMPAVAAWVGQHVAQEMYLTAVSEAELRYGEAFMPAGKRRDALKAIMTNWLVQGFRERLLPFDSAAARAYAQIAACGRLVVRPVGGDGCQIATLCSSRGAVLVTHNVRHSKGVGVELIDPWIPG